MPVIAEEEKHLDDAPVDQDPTEKPSVGGGDAAPVAEEEKQTPFEE